MIQADIKALRLETIRPTDIDQGGVRLTIIGDDDGAIVRLRLTLPETQKLVEGLMDCAEGVQNMRETLALLRQIPPEGSA